MLPSVVQEGGTPWALKQHINGGVDWSTIRKPLTPPFFFPTGGMHKVRYTSGWILHISWGTCRALHSRFYFGFFVHSTAYRLGKAGEGGFDR